MMQRRTLLFAALLLAGCTTLTGPAGTRRWTGRFSLRAVTAQGAETAAGKYRLTATGDTYELEILSPLNGVLGKVTVTPSEARVERGSQPDMTAATETELMESAFGFSLPVAVFAAWLDGTPAAAAPFERTTAGAFRQKDWLVAPKPSTDGRPALLKLSRTDPSRTLSLTLTVAKETVDTPLP